MVASTENPYGLAANGIFDELQHLAEGGRWRRLPFIGGNSDRFARLLEQARHGFHVALQRELQVGALLVDFLGGAFRAWNLLLAVRSAVACRGLVRRRIAGWRSLVQRSAQLERLATPLSKNGYGQYLMSLVERGVVR